MYSISLRNVLRLVLVAALAGFALVAVASGPATAAGVVCQRTLSSGVVNEPITEESPSLLSTIDIPEDGLVVTDVDVTVNIAHPSPSDLVLVLNATNDPKAMGRFTVIFSHQGMPTAGGDLVGTVFDDAASTPIAVANPPFTGRFIPFLPLANLNGASGGVLQLGIEDSVPGNSGSLKSWSVTFRYSSCDFDADGVEDHVDQCRDLTARTATGCPLTSRKVTAKYKSGEFRGALSSQVAGCRAGRAVTVFRKRPGPDREVGTASTRADGSFRLARAKKRGRYYAFSPLVAVADRAECPAVKSSFRIR